MHAYVYYIALYVRHIELIVVDDNLCKKLLSFSNKLIAAFIPLGKWTI